MNSVQIMITSRRERLKQEIRSEILAAARDLFLTEGYANVSMRKIADRVGCAPDTIYLHFEDKDAILSAICVSTFAILDKHMEAIASDQSDPLERLRRGGRQFIQFGLDHPDHYRLTFGGAYVGPKDEASQQAGQHSFDCLRRCVGMCMAAGELRSTDVEEVAQSLFACVHGVVMLLIGMPHFPLIERNRLIDSVLDVLIEGIRKR